MIDVYPFAGYPVAVYGLDEAGLFTARALFAGEAELSAWDENPANREMTEKAGITPRDFSSDDLQDFTTLVVSAHAWKNDPAARALATRAKEQNIEVICDVELLARTQREAAYVGIAGAHGKSLTAALVTYLLQVTGREAEMAGLSGTSALNTDPLGMEGAYVVEMTPFRIAHTVSITFDVAVLLNLENTKNGEAAMPLFHRQTTPRAAVICMDDKPSQAIYRKLSKAREQRIYPFSIKQDLQGGVFVRESTLYDSFDKGDPIAVMDLSSIPHFAGPHAQANVAAAFATVRAIGVQPHAAMAAINSFPGLVDHRETIEKIDGVLYINDAAASSLECAASSFSGYENIHWIAGGQGEVNLTTKEPLKNVSERIKGAYLFGEAGLALSEYMKEYLSTVHFSSLDDAFHKASQAALKGGAPAVVIYAPGYAGKDTTGGDSFRDLVNAVAGERDDED